jgi:hypothetical protein
MTQREREDLFIQMMEQLKHISDNQTKTLEQVRLTNGRVSSLEKWRAYFIGGGIVIVTIIGWLVSVIRN